MSASRPNAFRTWCDFLSPTEGGLSLRSDDPGNFTPDGRLVGTKFGIAAISHPNIDIPNLTIEDADRLRKTEYWDQVLGDHFPGPIAFVLAEAAYGSGPKRARMQMQEALGVKVDGVFGPQTMTAMSLVASKPSKFGMPLGSMDDLLTEFSSRRLLFEASLSNWEDAKGGWTRRLFRGLVIARLLA